MNALDALQRALQARVLRSRSAIDPQIAAVTRADASERLQIYEHAYVAPRRRAGTTATMRCVALGEAAFGELATAFALATPSRHRSIRDYGAEFTSYIASHVDGSAGTWSRVRGVGVVAGECVRCCRCAPLTVEVLAGVTPDRWPELRFRVHPTVRRYQCDKRHRALATPVDRAGPFAGRSGGARGSGGRYRAIRAATTRGAARVARAAHDEVSVAAATRRAQSTPCAREFRCGYLRVLATTAMPTRRRCVRRNSCEAGSTAGLSVGLKTERTVARAAASASVAVRILATCAYARSSPHSATTRRCKRAVHVHSTRACCANACSCAATIAPASHGRSDRYRGRLYVLWVRELGCSDSRRRSRSSNASSSATSARLRAASISISRRARSR